MNSHEFNLKLLNSTRSVTGAPFNVPCIHHLVKYAQELVKLTLLLDYC